MMVVQDDDDLSNVTGANHPRRYEVVDLEEKYHLQDDEDDYDIIAIQEEEEGENYDDHQQDNKKDATLLMMFSQQQHDCSSPSQKFESRRITRRRRRQHQHQRVPLVSNTVTNTKNDILPPSSFMMSYEKHHHSTTTAVAEASASNDNDNVLNESSAFASLENLLNEQTLSLSMTQQPDEHEPAEGSVQTDTSACTDNHQTMENKVNDNYNCTNKCKRLQESSSNNIRNSNSNKIGIVDQPPTDNDSMMNNSFLNTHDNDGPGDTQESDNSASQWMDDFDAKGSSNKPANATVAVAITTKDHLKQFQHYSSHQSGSSRTITSTTVLSENATMPSRFLRQEAQKQKGRHNNNNDIHNFSNISNTSPTTSKRGKTLRSKSADRLFRNSCPLKKRRAGSKQQKPRSMSPHRSTIVQKTKSSIVGHRPSHWAAAAATAAAISATSRAVTLSRLDSGKSYHRHDKHEQQQKQRRQLAAAAAATSSLLMPPPVVPGRRATIHPNIFNPRRPSTHHPMSPSRTTTSLPTYTNTTLNKSFKPDFLPVSHREKDQDTESQRGDNEPMNIDTFDDDALMVTETTHSNDSNASFLATIRANHIKGRRKAFNNNNNSTNPDNSHRLNLSRLLKDAKSAIRIDGTRLRSGEYPFSNKVTSRFDLNDPRNRASSYMDVTLIGNDLVPWQVAAPARGRQTISQNMTVLGYIHTVRHDSNRDLPISTTNRTCISTDMATPTSGLAWISLSTDTVQEHNLFQRRPRGYQLRIYNAIVTVIGATNESEVEPESKTATCRHSVLCTQLCEPYPLHVLGPLEQPSVEHLSLSSQPPDVTLNPILALEVFLESFETNCRAALTEDGRDGSTATINDQNYLSVKEGNPPSNSTKNLKSNSLATKKKILCMADFLFGNMLEGALSTLDEYSITEILAVQSKRRIFVLANPVTKRSRAQEELRSYFCILPQSTPALQPPETEGVSPINKPSNKTQFHFCNCRSYFENTKSFMACGGNNQSDNTRLIKLQRHSLCKHLLALKLRPFLLSTCEKLETVTEEHFSQEILKRLYG